MGLFTKKWKMILHLQKSKYSCSCSCFTDLHLLCVLALGPRGVVLPAEVLLVDQKTHLLPVPYFRYPTDPVVCRTGNEPFQSWILEGSFSALVVAPPPTAGRGTSGSWGSGRRPWPRWPPAQRRWSAGSSSWPRPPPCLQRRKHIDNIKSKIENIIVTSIIMYKRSTWNQKLIDSLWNGF